MSRNDYWRSIRRNLIIIASLFVLGGCLPAGEEDVADDTPGALATDHHITGSVGDGPVVAASISIRDKDGNELGTTDSSSTADFDVVVETLDSNYPLTLRSSGGTDLVTSATPDFALVTAVLQPGEESVANVNPFTTIAVELARDLAGGVNSQNVTNALAIVYRELNAGLDSLDGSAAMDVEITGANIAELLRASEALGEVVRRTRDILNSAGFSLDGDDVVAALGSDLTDEVIDGRGGSRANPRIAAIASIAMAQVAVETMQNRLQVQGSDAMIRLDNALAQVFQGQPSPSLDELPATAAMLEAAATGILVADLQVPASQFAALGAELATVTAGMSPAQVRQQLQSNAGSAFVASLAAMASASDNRIDEIMQVLRAGEVPPENRAPTITGVPPTDIAAGTNYRFEPQASDADGDALTFAISGRPAWASFDTSSGVLQGTPQAVDAGSNQGIVISVTDGQDTVSLPAYTITVSNVAGNSAPEIGGTPATTVVANDAYSFTPSANDPNGDALVFSVENLPGWASFDTQTGRLSGTPGDADVGDWSSIGISVSDGSDSAALPVFSILVTELPISNRAPQISGTPSVNVQAGNAWSFQPSASDPDGDSLTFSISGRPSWAAFDNGSGRLSGTPAETDAGSWGGIEISVSDGSASASLPAFTVVVEAAPSNTPPEILGDPASQVVAGSAYVFAPTANDADGDSLSFSVAGLPSWASFDDGNGRIGGTPGSGDVGTYSNISITVSDGEDNATLGPFSITVEAIVLGSATLSWTPPSENTDGTVLTDLSGYRIYWGTEAGQYTESVTIDNPGVTTYVVENLAPGTYEFVSTALNSAGVESDYSNPATKTID